MQRTIFAPAVCKYPEPSQQRWHGTRQLLQHREVDSVSLISVWIDKIERRA